jgi:TPR repeat protein
MAAIGLGYFSVGIDGASAKGRSWTDRAIAMGGDDPNVLFTLGKALAGGAGGDGLRTKGLALVNQAASLGLPKAMRHLAVGYGTGLWGPVDKMLARQWLERAAAAGDTTSAVEYAKALAATDPAEIGRAKALLEKAAATSVEAARQLGLLCLSGVFGDGERANAGVWLEKAASAGDRSAMRGLAEALATGNGGVNRDPGEALRWYERAAEAGDGKAMVALAAAYEAGFGTEINPALAAKWSLEARRAGVE